MAAEHERKWWKEGVAYQVYPASFNDSNGDGLGDIPGIIAKLDYLKGLGVDIVWVSPMYDSPQVDMGYDISNYEAVYPPYGTVEDMELLISECHKRAMRVILDLVVNHTSDQHAWFRESRSSKDNPKRDWYIWRAPRLDAAGNRSPPNNWRSNFGGSAWAYDAATGEYYLHLFARAQPDLNWESAACRRAVYDSAMRFWLDRGVDGFRVDTANMYSKGDLAADAPVVDAHAADQPAWALYANGPRIHEFLREVKRDVLDGYGDVVTVGELPHTPDPARVLDYVRAGAGELSMVFQFDVVDLGQGSPHKYRFAPWRLPRLKAAVARWQRFIDGTDGWTTAFLENHDQGRSVSRYASDAPGARAAAAKMLAVLLCSLTGTLFIYQGQEMGMVNIPKTWPIEDYQDIEGINYYKQVAERTNNDPKELAAVLHSLAILGRDNARTPMQWDGSRNAGFTTAEKPWMKVNDSYTDINVARQLEEPDSVLHFWRAMVSFRKAHLDLLVYGSFEVLDMENETTFVFVKKHKGDRALVALNFSGEEQQVALPDDGGYELQVDNYSSGHQDQGTRKKAPGGAKVTLRPWEAQLYIRS